ncbi:MAG: tRNA adenosine(34) deaminase TadA, partial [Gammaproteobacteria bacterium]|nr:tRNA adenosine(34) deaminase TadA [Gammaproteobacteria bacterium]
MNKDEHWMRHALKLAEYAEHNGEVPVGAVIVQNDMVIAEGWNQPISTHDATAHAEIVALRKAGYTLSNYRLPEATLYVTLEPCVMCVGAMIHARVNRLVYAATEPKTGAIESAFELCDPEKHNHTIEVVSGVLADESSELLKSFFQRRRAEKKLEVKSH